MSNLVDCFPVPDKPGIWHAYYADRTGLVRCVRDALGRAIECHSKELALSVARYRRARLARWVD